MDEQKLERLRALAEKAMISPDNNNDAGWEIGVQEARHPTSMPIALCIAALRSRSLHTDGGK